MQSEKEQMEELLEQPDIHQLKFDKNPKAKQFKLLTKHKTHHSDIFSLRFDFDDNFLAAGLADGSIQLYQENEPTFRLETMFSPVTALRWRPNFHNKAKTILVSANAEGEVVHWHAPSGKLLHRMIEPNNSVLCLDFNFDGTQFATGGKDFCVRIYDDDIKSIQHTFHQADWGQRGHANRIFAVKFLPDQPNVIISGGWDANVLIWDIREKQCVGQFYGPSISGDSLDYKNEMILTGSYRTDHQLQLWDWRTRKLYKEIEWTGKEGDQNKSYYIYAAQFCKSKDHYIYAGSSGVHEFKIFNINDGQSYGGLVDLEKSILTFDQMNQSDTIAVSGMDGLINIISVNLQ